MMQPGPPTNSTTGTIEISDWARLPVEPLVSIYMLTYNHERYIAEAIEGVLAQECEFPIELIIGEDCSTDRTGEIVREYQQKNPQLIRVLTSDKNVGAHRNGARCRSACRGIYIAICEGDDYWHHPKKLQIQVDVMSKSANVTLCHTDYDRRIGNRIKHNRNKCHPRMATDYVSMLRGGTVKTATTMYRGEILKRFNSTPFNNTSWPFGDRNRELFASVTGKVHYIALSTATSRKVYGSATNSGPKAGLRMSIAGFDCRESFLQHFAIPPAEATEIRILATTRIVRAAFYAGNKRVFLEGNEKLRIYGCKISTPVLQLKLLLMRLPLFLGTVNAVKRMLLRVSTA